MKVGDKRVYLVSKDIAVIGEVYELRDGTTLFKRDSYIDHVKADRILEAVDGVLTFPPVQFMNINLQGLDSLKLKHLDLSQVPSVTYCLSLTLTEGLKVSFPPEVKDYEVWALGAAVNAAPRRVAEDIAIHGATDIAMLSLFQSGCEFVSLMDIATNKNIRNPQRSLFRSKLMLMRRYKKFAKLR